MAPAPDAEKKPERSYFSSAVDSINPWSGIRSTTPTPKDPAPSSNTPPPPFTGSQSADHSTSHLYGQSQRRYPADCPPLRVQWFHAVDVPKRKPKFLQSRKGVDDSKPPVTPKKYVAFSPEDSRSVEATYQTILEELEKERASTIRKHPSRSQRSSTLASNESMSLRSVDGVDDARTKHHVVHVQEDFLFQVDIETRELSPVYWLGPVYDVRRGTWFYQESSGLRPCEENLAAQLEEGYLKAKPWLYPPRLRSNSGARDMTPKASSENLRAAASATAATASGSQADPALKPAPVPAQHQPQTHRLFGTYMNSVATYQDESVAFLTSDGVLSWVTSTMYERFAGGAYMSGVKLVRGYSEPNRAKEKEAKESKESKESKDVKGDGSRRPSTPPAAKPALALDERQQRLLKRRSAPPGTTASDPIDVDESPPSRETEGSRLQRQLSSLMEGREDPETEEEKVRQREETEIRNDYNAQAGETQGREIEHLVLVTHGIGQLLGLRMESVNFVHDVNIMRKTLKSVYSSSADLRALNSEAGDGPGNCRIQVLPVCWRHLLDFPKKREERKRERDIGEAYLEEDDYPSLEDITVEGVAFARSLISDLALDVLLYQSAYREQIAQIVCKESNRVFKLFMERNPGFSGKVHVVGHSLGSAIMFDILCRQKETAGRDRGSPTASATDPLRFWPSSPRRDMDRPVPPTDPRELKFDFGVDDFYCLGSPIGLFQMLKGRTIAARHQPDAIPSESPMNPDHMDDPFFGASDLSSGTASSGQRISAITGLPFSVSSPKVGQLFNIFHPSDPIAYRVEPLISPAMSSLKSQALPYTKKGIFGSVAPQGITGLGAKVGQSVSGLWSSLSAGIASNILNRSLGLTQEEVAKMSSAGTHQQQPNPSQAGAGTNISAGGVISDGVAQYERASERKRQLANNSGSLGAATSAGKGDRGGNDATLIDDELETLYSRFQSRRLDGSDSEEGGCWGEQEDKAKRLRKEEMKVRALNRNGRVDYSIQESALDFNPINTIASHMSYWSDEDVSHFIMSQLLSNRSRPGRGS